MNGVSPLRRVQATDDLLDLGADDDEAPPVGSRPGPEPSGAAGARPPVRHSRAHARAAFRRARHVRKFAASHPALCRQISSLQS